MTKKKLIIGIAVLAILGLIFLVTRNSSVTHPYHLDPTRTYDVASVIDGDTIRVRADQGHIATIRLLGINTPETVDPRKPVECYGKEASDETKSLLENKQVHLSVSPGREEKDKYGRFLAYVFREDGLDVNLFLLRHGFAREYTVGTPYSRQAEFRSAQNEAKKQNIGLWSACTVTSSGI